MIDPSGGGRRGVDWRFNAWGGLDGPTPWDRDERAAAKVLEVEGAERYRAPLVLEGGSIHVDGEGTVLTTEECLLNPNRNPELSREQIEQALCDYLGREKVIWLGAGVYDDETDGHVDNLACFVRPGVGAARRWAEDATDPQHAVARDALPPPGEATRRGRAARSRSLDLPAPRARWRSPPRRPAGSTPVAGHACRAAPATGSRPPTSTSTSPTARVVFPLLDERCDEQAAEMLARCFPEREVVGVPAREILLGGGNIHCITQQVPAVTAVR